MASVQNFGELIPRAAPADRIWQIEVSEAGSDREITLGAFHAAADSVARGLLKKGLDRGTRVGILAANSAEYLMAFFGIVRAGMVAVPINYKLPAATVAGILDDADVRFVFADAERAGQASGRPVVRLDDAKAWAGFADPGPFESPDMGDDEFALILYTSGSSGRPKGVPLTHGGYVWASRVLSGTMPPMDGKRMLVAAPLYHMNGLLQSTLMSMSGGTVVLMRRFDPRGYLEAAARNRCDIVTSVPTMLALAVRETEALATLDLSPVKLVIMGSAPVSEALFDEAGRIFPQAAISNTWGTTEGSPVVFGPHPDGKPKPKMSVGYPMPEAEIRLVGGSSDDEGVIWVRSGAVMPGYLNMPEESARCLHDGWYDTGDIMRRDADGFYYFVGRADDMFVCGGENVYPTEVERLLESHPGIAQASVLPLADDIKGMVPVAYLVLAPGAVLTADEVKAFALAEGPAYRHPRHVAFLEALPLAGTNKVDRQALTARAADEFGAAQRARRASI